MSVGMNIREKRLALDMTQKELAEKVNVDQSIEKYGIRYYPGTA